MFCAVFLAFLVDYYLVSCVFSWFCVFIVSFVGFQSVLWFFLIVFVCLKCVLCVLIGFVCF